VKHPIQPVVADDQGVLRFKANAIVEHLLEAGRRYGVDMNSIAAGRFSREDREQFAQLIGYSVSGFGDLSYASSDTFGVIDQLYNEDGTLKDEKVSQQEARIAYLEGELKEIRDGLRKPIARLFQIHPDDLP
jgi:hypothetical protein